MNHARRDSRAIARSAFIVRLPVAAANFATLIADGEAVATAQPAAAQHFTPVFRFHAMQETMFAPARDALRLPSSFGHCANLIRWCALLGAPMIMLQEKPPKTERRNIEPARQCRAGSGNYTCGVGSMSR